MKHLRIYISALLLIASVSVFAQKNIRITSPDKRITFTFKFTDSLPVYSVTFKGKTLIKPSTLSLSFDKTDNFGKDLKISNALFSKGEDNYTLVVSKTKKVHDEYQEVTIPMQEHTGVKRLINLVVRVFNDGLAFRYEIPQQKNWTSFELTAENTTFNLAGDPTVLTAFLRNFTTPHEARHYLMPFSQIKADTLMDMPTLIEFPGNIYMAIAEAELVDYPGMYLVKYNGMLQSRLSPLLGQGLIKVKASLPHHSPWRVLLISDRVGALIESNIITSLNAPCKIRDVSWIKSGKTDFHWWNGDVMPDTTFAPGINFNFNKYYIDFCARAGIEYHTVIGYGDVAWYENDGIGYKPGPHSDLTKPIPGLNMQRICDYAKKKGVGIRVWVHWAALYPELEKAFTQYEKWGIKGVMIDFMNRDDQEMVNIQNRIVQVAAKHHLDISFHGAYPPTGLSRTYPNLFAREGTLNYENDKAGNVITPDDDISIPFTRGLAGTTDYHLGGFRAVPISKYKAHYTRPLVVGTRCHMLAMYVVLENFLQMVCDYPEAYEGQKGFGFIKEVPTTWDETRVPGAKVDRWVTIARRKGCDWYVGTINNSAPRVIHIPMNFLPAGKDFIAETYSDAPDSRQYPNRLIKQTIHVHHSDTLTVYLVAGGGQVMYIKRE